MSEESNLEKSEAPTPQRLKKARKDGQIPRSKELVSWLVLLSGWILLWLIGEYLACNMGKLLKSGLSFNLHTNDGNEIYLSNQFTILLRQTLIASAPLFVGITLVSIISPMLIGGIFFSGKVINIDFRRLNYIKGIKRLFSMQILMEVNKAIFKILLIGSSCGITLWLIWLQIMNLSKGVPLKVMSESLLLISQCVLCIIIALTPIMGFDILYQIYNHIKKLQMSHHDIKEEHKEQEGDPYLKSKIRQRQQALHRMIQDVSNADVVIINPMHYAVALKYEQMHMTAPKLLAKGAGIIALNIRRLAKQQGIPILESPILAQALYKHCEVGDFIPVALYGAVAEVLAWVYNLRKWHKHGGLRPHQPSNLYIPKKMNYAKQKGI